ncbi:MAG TPA: carboxymuconolactone decarboxylase family protein [Azospirillaceae bacterium]|nr:carboxymuconolactone decarboxylase family protein [Azospirillaceae bacterium]
MTLDDLKAALPDYAKDLKLNLSSVLGTSSLSPRLARGAALASAIASRNPQVIRAIAAGAETLLDAQALAAAKAAAAVMGMNNIYYRSIHLMPGRGYGELPARLRMQVIGNPGVDKLDFELWSLAVSAVNGCGMCLEAHEREVLGKGATREMVQDVIRIAAVIHAAAVALEGEAALRG